MTLQVSMRDCAHLEGSDWAKPTYGIFKRDLAEYGQKRSLGKSVRSRRVLVFGPRWSAARRSIARLFQCYDLLCLLVYMLIREHWSLVTRKTLVRKVSKYYDFTQR